MVDGFLALGDSFFLSPQTPSTKAGQLQMTRSDVTLAGGLVVSSKSSTRLLPVSLIYTLSDPSTATPRGPLRLVPLIPPLLLALTVKAVPLAPCPNTMSAVMSPLPAVALAVSGVMYSNTRLLLKSAM